MIPEFDREGLLPAGIHKASWEEFTQRFGGYGWRKLLLRGLWAAIVSLRDAGCKLVYVDRSFVTDKEAPGDFDACWEEAGVDPIVLDPVLLTFANGRAEQKAKYLGELFPASFDAVGDGFTFLDFFQTDRDGGRRKGIIAIDLGELE